MNRSRAVAARSRKRKLLKGTRVYLSGPMDFVASRADEAKYGWRNRVGQFLGAMGVTVFDPWNKPQVRGLHEYGREGIDTNEIKNTRLILMPPVKPARSNPALLRSIALQ